MTQNILTHKYLKSILSYNQITGEFIWKLSPTNTSKIGKPIKTKLRGGYSCFTIRGRLYRAHRVAWFYVYGTWPKVIDHINHNKSDNRLCNIRSVTNHENSKNLKLCARNNSGITGVHWDKGRNKWHSQIHVNYKSNSLGRYFDFFEAVCVRKSAENKYGFHVNHGLNTMLPV